MSLRLFSSNRLDLLSRELSRELKAVPASPLARETIVIQSRGMERWLSMQIATHLGVCANFSFPFPNAFIDEVFRLLGCGRQEHSIFDPRLCMWRIMEMLPPYLDKPEFEELKNYLSGPDRNLKQLQLSGRIAETFDHYTIYRPEMVERWQAGHEEHWQAVLWRGLAEGREREHRAALAKELIGKMESASDIGAVLPHRVSIFGISYLPGFYLHILNSLARLMRVDIYYLNPSREYWGDIASRRDIKRLSAGRRSGLSPEELYLESGNSLLASMGGIGRDFFDLLVSMDCEIISLPSEEREKENLLGKIQADILNLREPKSATEKVVLTPEDQSIQIHSCHSPMREVEVLYDHVLRMFEQDRELLPKDIIVMTPDIESYAPYIQAVFGAPEEESKRIPFSIADRGMRRESRVIDTFLKLLELPGERITAPQVLDIMESPFVRAAFELGDGDMDLVLKWVNEVQIKWGVDKESTLKWSPVPLHENTWRAGIERLLLGYALPAREERLFGGVLPYDNIEGGETSVLGGLLSFLDLLFETLKSLETPRTPGEWSDYLAAVLAGFFKPGEDSDIELQSLRRVIAELRKIQELSGFCKAVDLALIRWHLGKNLEQESFGFGFMTGGITFCSMLPMRSIPFKVICLIGMNENAFPRRSRAAEFDLIAAHPERGDRSVRNEDRYLFLEAILSATEKLYVSYTGQSSKDNKAIPPCVPVSELMDYINKVSLSPKTPEGSSSTVPVELLVTKHHLQPFNPGYFRGEGLFSYSREHLATAAAMLEPKRTPPPFLSKGLDHDEGLREISVADLCRFFKHPVRYLLNKRLGIYLGKETFLLEDVERFDLGALERYELNQKLVQSAISGTDPRELHELQKASGKLPHGTPGDFAFRESAGQVAIFSQKTVPYIQKELLDPLDVELAVGAFTITGRIDSVYRHGLVQYRYAVLRAHDYLTAWIRRLLLNAAAKPGYPAESFLIGLDNGWKWKAERYSPVDNSHEILEQLLEIYWEGMTRPLHFFADISMKYASKALLKGIPQEEARKAAESDWEQLVANRDSDRNDEYLQLCFKSDNPVDSDFQRLAETIFGPLFNSRQEV